MKPELRIPNREGSFDLTGIGERIRLVRKAVSNESQSELGQALGICRRSLAKYEQGTVSVPIEILIKISEHYNVSVLWLLGAK